MLLTCTLLSLPAYCLFWTGYSRGDPRENFNEIILALSLGSLGDQIQHVNELDLSLNTQSLALFCETGVIGTLTKHGVALA